MNEIPFIDCLSDIIDNRGKTCPTSKAGIPLIATNCIKNDSLFPVFEKVRYVSLETYKTWFRGHPMPGDLIFVNKGTPGQVCLVPDPINFCIAQDMVAIRANAERIYPRYLLAVLRSNQIQRRIENMHVGTLIPHFKKGDFDKLSIPVPESNLQKYIGDLYYNLSLKIDKNRKMNETLEAIAQAIFKHWFIDFEFPDEKGKPYKSSGGQLVYSNELGKEMPKGWELICLGDIVEIFDSIRAPLSSRERQNKKGKYPYYGAASVVDYIDEYLFEGVYLLLAEDGTVINSDDTPVTQYVWGKFWVNNHAHIIRGSAGISTEYLALFLKTVNIRPYITGAVQPKLNQENLKRIPFIKPIQRVSTEFSALVLFLFNQLRQNVDESQTLVTIRDTLLPKLMSGEIKVGNFQAAGIK